MIVVPFNRCDSILHHPLSSRAGCNDSAGIFKRLTDTAFSFFSRFFQPHFLIINVRALVARGTFSGHTEQNSFVRLGLVVFFFFGRDKQAGSLSSSSHVFYTTDPSISSITWELVRNRSHVKILIGALLCYMTFSALLTDDCHYLIREN